MIEAIRQVGEAVNQSPLAIFGVGVVAGISTTSVLLFLLLILIPLVFLKGYALWHAAKRNEKWWFIVLLVVNTLGILELIYLILIAKVIFQRRQ